MTLASLPISPSPPEVASPHRILLLGSGYVGLPLLRALVSSGNVVHVTTTTTTGNKLSTLQAITAHTSVWTSHQSLRPLVDAFRPSVVVAAISPGRNGNPRVFTETATRIVEALTEGNGGDGAVVIFTSSISVYGEASEPDAARLITEAAATTSSAPSSSSRAKYLFAAEDILLGAGPRISAVILRLGGIYGPQRTLERIYGFSAGKRKHTQSGLFPTNWVHLNDVMGIIQFLLKPEHHHRYCRQNLVLNVVDDDGSLTWKAMFEMAREVSGFQDVVWDDTVEVERKVGRVGNGKLKALGYELEYSHRVLGCNKTPCDASRKGPFVG